AALPTSVEAPPPAPPPKPAPVPPAPPPAASMPLPAATAEVKAAGPLAPPPVVPPVPAPVVPPQPAESAAAPPVAPPAPPAASPAPPPPPVSTRIMSGRFKDMEPGAVIDLIREAVDSNRIDLFLQPIVTLPQRKVRYYEAVARLRAGDGDP